MAESRRGRFAPSPTGDLHLGNLRTALLAWLWSRSSGGGFVVRMEDLDRVTSSREHEERQLADLAAIGVDGDDAVVRQSERFELYDAAIERLTEAGLTYPCYCTRREIAEAVRAPHGAPADGGYPGTCRELGPAERREREEGGRPPALRFRAHGAAVGFVDEVAGPRSGLADDVVVRRNDGVPAYNLAVVVDDAAQGIGVVVRGDDLLAATPGQIHLGRALGLPDVSYAHVPLVLGPTGDRLAKRDGAVTLADRRSRGESPADVVRFLLRTAGIGVPDRSDAPDGADAADAAAVLRHVADRFDASALLREPYRLTADDL